jgi:hypothetical protein
MIYSDAASATHSWAECVNGVYICSDSQRIQTAANAWHDARKSVDALHTEVLGMEAIVGNANLWQGPTAEAVGSLLKLLVNALRCTADAISPVGHSLDIATENLKLAVEAIRVCIPPAQAVDFHERRVRFAASGSFIPVTAIPDDPKAAVLASKAVDSLKSTYAAVTFPPFDPPKLPTPAFAPGQEDGTTVPAGAGGPQVVPMPQLPMTTPLTAPAPVTAADPTATADPSSASTPDPTTALAGNNSPVASPMAGAPRAAPAPQGMNAVGASGTTGTGSNMYPPMYPGTGGAGAGQQQASVLRDKIREDLLHDQGVFDVPPAPPGVLA